MTNGNNSGRNLRRMFVSIVGIVGLISAFCGCARMGQPDGGWYDETPPRVVGSTPDDKGTNVTNSKITIHFNEFIKIDNPTENVVVSPPQLEVPEIKATGKKIVVELLDSLKPNTTYTIDFSDAISDNNEGNPLGNYTYSFSTGEQIDTMEVSGYVIEAKTLEPVKGIMVGLYPANGSEYLDENSNSQWNDSIFRTRPFLRVSRTDSRGHFVIKGIANGSYRIFALKDVDGNYCYTQKNEMVAFNHDIIVPSSKPDVRHDTIWTDTLHIRSITPVNYTHFLPDDIVLKGFEQELTDRFFLKAERKTAPFFQLFFTYGHDSLPEIRGLNFNEKDAFIVEPSQKKDTITYWLRDSSLVNQDTLYMELKYYITDSLGALVLTTDSQEILSKDPYEKRMKRIADEEKELKKKLEKALKKGEEVDSSQYAVKKKPLEPKWAIPGKMTPENNLLVTFDTPILEPDTSTIHLYSMIDSVWYKSPYKFFKREDIPRTYELRGEWKPGLEYSLETDSLAFTNIYGLQSSPFKQGFKVGSMDEFSSLIFTFEGMTDKDIVAMLVDKGDNVVKKVKADKGVAEFYYLNAGTYYIRMFIDENHNGMWDTGDYDLDLQPEKVYYYPKEIECKEKWDLSLSWNPESTPTMNQKPGVLVKQKGEKKKATIKSRNVDRAREKGIEYIEGVTGVKL